MLYLTNICYTIFFCRKIIHDQFHIMSLETNPRVQAILAEKRPTVIVGSDARTTRKNEEFLHHISRYNLKVAQAQSLSEILNQLNIRLTRHQLREVFRAAKINAQAREQTANALIHLRFTHASTPDEAIVRPEHIIDPDGKRVGIAVTLYTHQETLPQEPDILSREELDRALIREIAKAERTHTPLGLVLISTRNILPPALDGTTQFSRSATDPTVGYTIGRCLLDTARATDAVYYMGPEGKEFAVILTFPETPSVGDGIAPAAHRYASALQKCLGTDIPLDIGIARHTSCMPTFQKKEEKAEWLTSQSTSLLLRADMALGHAKNVPPNGNGVHIFEFDMTQDNLVIDHSSAPVKEEVPAQS